MRHAPGIFIAAVLVPLLVGMIYILHQRYSSSVATGQANAISQEIGGPFELIEVHGRQVSDRDFRGKWLLVFFGYTHCPDVCPTTLSDMAETLTQLGSLADKVQPIFITVDPERDTPQVLASYLASFDPKIVGLTGTPEQIAAAAKAYHVRYAKRQIGNDYYMDHSAIIHVVRPDGTYSTFFFTTAGPLEMAKRLREIISKV